MVSPSIWAARHGHALVSTLGHLWRHGLATLLTVMVMALALAVPLALDVLVGNVRQATGDLTGAVGLSVYLKSGVSEQRAHQLASAASELPDVAGVTLVTASEGLEQLRRSTGLGAALGALPDNPLPHVLTLRPGQTAPARLEALRTTLEHWPEVDTVQLDRDWVQRLNALVGLLRQLLWVLGALVALGMLAVIGNTIRLEIEARRPEIEVTKFVGGSNAFVRRPLLYAGALTGLAAALLAFALVAAGRWALAAPAAHLAETYASSARLTGPDLRELGWVLLAGGGLGWLGAWIAGARELSRIEPRST